MIEPLRIELDLACSAEQAFRTWTERFATWWPRGHTVSGDPDEIVLEPRLGGRIYERTRDGAEIDWGMLTAWDPPRALSYIYGTFAATGVMPLTSRSAFHGLDERRCRLEIVHTWWQRLGAQGAAWRNANQAGWSGLLPSYLAVLVVDPVDQPSP